MMTFRSRCVGRAPIMHKYFFGLLAIGALNFAVIHPARAGSNAADAKEPASSDGVITGYLHGATELQFSLGTEISLQDTSARRPNIDYGLAVIRLGRMLDSVHGDGWLRGNDEVMIEAMGGPIYTGPGSALGGLCLVYRRNFLSADGRMVPYLNLGAGGIYSDAFHDRIQRALGSPFEFDLQVGAGLKFRFSPRWSFDAEISYRHLSNADFAPRNYGTNALGGLVGISRAF